LAITSHDIQNRERPAVDATVLTALRGAEYLGSHPSAPRRFGPVDIVFTTDKIVMTRGRREFGSLPWESLLDLRAATWETVERHITGPRVVLLGLWSLVFRKKTSFSHLIVTDRSGEWAFGVPGIRPDELRAGLGPLRAYLPRPTSPATHA
jgi:hypothetical protein